MNESPPRIARWLASLALPRVCREYLLGDLEEEYQVRRRRCPAAARRWFRSQCCAPS